MNVVTAELRAEVAFFDALSICDKLGSTLGAVSSPEVHLIAYLSHLLPLYRGRATGTWGCTFAVTEEGYPYSPDVQAALDAQVDRGDLAPADSGYFTITSKGKEELAILRSLNSFQEREEFLSGACASTLALPTGTIRDAIAHAPEIQGALRAGHTRLLMTRSGLDVLYEQFEALSMAIGVNLSDLMAPAVVWLTYLLELSDLLELSEEKPAD